MGIYDMVIVELDKVTWGLPFSRLRTQFYMLSRPPPPLLHVYAMEMYRRLDLTPPPLPLGAYVLNGSSRGNFLKLTCDIAFPQSIRCHSNIPLP